MSPTVLSASTERRFAEAPLWISHRKRYRQITIGSSIVHQRDPNNRPIHRDSPCGRPSIARLLQFAAVSTRDEHASDTLSVAHPKGRLKASSSVVMEDGAKSV